MADYKQIRAEIQGSFIHKPDAELLQKINIELDLLELTEGLEGKNNLETFHNTWLKHRRETGHQNEIHSWTAYCLGMTEVKPTKDFLPTRRAFARSGFPDIDTDFDDECRDLVYGYLIDKYGRENVGNIGTYQKQKMKASVRSCSKATDAAYAFHLGDKENKTRNAALADEISKTLETLPTGLIRVKDHDGKEIMVKSLDKAYEFVPDFRAYMDKFPDIYRHARAIEGLTGAFSQHAAGVVISNIPLRNIAPLRANKKGLATAFPYEDLESMGLIKFDILAITTLTVIRDCLKLIKDTYGIEIDVTTIPLDDPKTLELYRKGTLTGVFQCENYGMQSTMRDICVDSFDDIMAAIALYRPGPMAFIPQYCQRKKKLQKVDYFHPSIEKLIKKHLDRTYGILCYQEQIMQICESMAGFSITQGYVMIKAVSKKKKELLDKYMTLFVDGAITKGVPRGMVEHYWKEVVIPFSEYGFNASVHGDTIIPTTRSDKKIRDFVGGEKVYCIDENGEEVETNVVCLHDHGYIESFEVTFDDDSTLICSENHKFLTEFGQVPLNTIYRNGLQLFGTHNDGGYYAQKEILHSPLWEADRKNIGIKASSGEIPNLYGMVGLGAGHATVTNTRGLVPRRIIQVVPVGKRRLYDIEVSCSTHNFILKNGIVTSNSHAACYALLSFVTAYLKGNYPDEFVCAFLNVWMRNAMNKSASKWDVVHRMEQDAARVSGVKILSRNLNECGLEYKIVRRKDPAMGIKQTEIQAPLCCKGLGYEAAKNIVENGPMFGKQPYTGPEDLAQRTNTAVVTAESIAALCDNGYIKGKAEQKNKDAIVKKFVMIREDLKLAQRKGVISCDIFG
ncbi:MAG: hypothetical protein HC888_00405 [Candidatus Competibacteraceae bacterium]|nr:hypothetical protein [Candidatus Competibacteraceae bacterium]